MTLRTQPSKQVYLLVLCSLWKQFQLSPRKQTPCKEAARGKRGRRQCLKWEQWSFMNISGIPQLQTAAGLSIGEVVVLAQGHRSRTLQEAAHSPYWLQQRRAGSAPNRKSTLKQASRIKTGRDIVQPDTHKQVSVCTRRKELRCSGKRDSSQHAGISCSGSLLDIYGRLN